VLLAFIKKKKKKNQWEKKRKEEKEKKGNFRTLGEGGTCSLLNPPSHQSSISLLSSLTLSPVAPCLLYGTLG
jgi:hypothetical protein